MDLLMEITEVLMNQELDWLDWFEVAKSLVKKVESARLESMSDLWNEAYEELKETEPKLVGQYEAVMSKEMSTILGNKSLPHGVPEDFTMKKEQMAALVAQKVAEAKVNIWKLKYGDNDILAKDLVDPVVNLINDAEEFGALSTNSDALIAWAGVSLLLPVSLGFGRHYSFYSALLLDYPAVDTSISIVFKLAG